MTNAASPPRTRRLFTALWPQQPVRDAIALWQHDWQWPRQATVVARERLHITLHFLGNVSSEKVEDLRAALKLPCPPFRLELGRPEVWRGGIAVLLAQQTPEALAGLHARVGAALNAMDMPLDDRPYRPHVTLARRAGGARPPERDPRLGWNVDDGFALVESLPGGRGYQVLNRFGQS